MGLGGLVKSVVGAAKDAFGAIPAAITGGDPLGAALSTVGSLSGSDLLSAGLSYFGTTSANNANRDIAQQQMAFQSNMSNTSYQRAVQDMIRAGLNPMLAYSQGGASTPSGASATMQDALTPAVNSARRGMEARAAVAKVQSEIGLQESQKDVNRAQVKKAASDTHLNGVLAEKARADAKQSIANAYQATTAGNRNKLDVIKGLSDTRKRGVETRLEQTYLPGRLTEEKIDSSKFGKATRWLDRGAHSARGVRDALVGRSGNLIHKDNSTRVFYH